MISLKSILLLLLLSDVVSSMAAPRKITKHSDVDKKTKNILEEFIGSEDLEEWKEQMQILRKIHRKSEKMSEDEVGKIYIPDVEVINGTGGITDVNEKSEILDYLYQGDIILTKSQLNTLISESQRKGARSKRQIYTFARKWSNNVINYYFANNLRRSTSNLVKYSLDFLESQTCLKFVENATARNSIQIFEDDGCYSEIGMSGGKQPMSLADGCDFLGTVVHEFFHALGFMHTQSRSDRDDYVKIDWNSIQKKYTDQFAKESEYTNTNIVDYEYGSVMHYAARAFSGSQLAMIPKDESMLYTLGSHLVSFLDIQALNKQYSCSCSKTLDCKNNGYTNPSSCDSCICPAGYGGKLCDTRQDTQCGEILDATENWKTIRYELGKTKQDYIHQQDLCTHWIKAPSDTTIEIRLERDSLQECYYGCIWSGIEPKVNKDQVNTNTRYCCSQFTGKVLTGQVNPLPVISWSALDWTSEHAFSYRYVKNPTTTSRPTTTTGTTSRPPTTTGTTTRAPTTTGSTSRPPTTTGTTSRPPTTTATTSRAPTTTATTSRPPTSTATTSRPPTSTATTSRPATTTATTSRPPTTTGTTSRPPTTTGTTTRAPTTTGSTSRPPTTIGTTSRPPTTTGTTSRPPTTTGTTSRAPSTPRDRTIQPNRCLDVLGAACSTVGNYLDPATQKFLCAKTFGWCGKPVQPCADYRGDSYCNNYNCSPAFPEVAEYECAKTCGFC